MTARFIGKDDFKRKLDRLPGAEPYSSVGVDSHGQGTGAR